MEIENTCPHCGQRLNNSFSTLTCPNRQCVFSDEFEILETVHPPINQKQLRQALPLFQASEIYSAGEKEYFLELEAEALTVLQANFDPKKKICIVASAGTVGTGKSTWNDCLYHLMENKEEVPFKFGHAQNTQT